MKKLGVVWSVAVCTSFVLSSLAQQPSHAHSAADGEIDQATEVMSRHTHNMGPHMKLSRLRAPSPDDNKRAEEIVAMARLAVEKYKDPRAAEADNYRMFMPNLKNQKQYHFTN